MAFISYHTLYKEKWQEGQDHSYDIPYIRPPNET